MTKRYAIIRNGTVATVTAADPEFVEPLGAAAIELPDDSAVGVGDVYSGGIFTRVPIPLAQAKRDRKDALLARWRTAEGAGFTFQTKRIESDAESVARIGLLAARARRAQADSEAFSVGWVAANESGLTLNRAELQDLEKAAGDHFKTCSDNARTLRQAINAASTLAEVTAVNVETGWPA